MSSPFASTQLFAVAASAVAPDRALAAAPQLDRLMLFGFLCMVVMLLCHVERHRSTSFVLALAISSAAMAVYGFVQGAWPLGLIQVVWSVSTFRKWLRRMNPIDRRPKLELRSRTSIPAEPWCGESRLTRLFGPSRFEN